MSQPTDGGVARCALTLASDQLARGWEVAIATHPEGKLARQAAERGVRVVPWEAERTLRRLPQDISGLRHVLRAERPGLVHLHSSKAGLAGRLLLRRRHPTVFQPHSWSFDALRGPLRAAAVAWERAAARWADVIVCVGENERERGEQHGVTARWQVIPNGVDLEKLSEAGQDARAEARRGLELGDGPLVVCVGRLSRQKGQDALLRAWPLVLERVPAATLVLVGEGPEEERLVRRAGRRTVFAGARDDVPEWLAAADVVAVPSRWEGMSLTMLEAMARGRSIVMTDVPGAREALAGAGGAIVPVENPAALAAALAERLLDPSLAAAEGRAARERAEQLYDVRLTTERFAELYGELAARAPAAPPTTPV